MSLRCDRRARRPRKEGNATAGSGPPAEGNEPRLHLALPGRHTPPAAGPLPRSTAPRAVERETSVQRSTATPRASDHRGLVVHSEREDE